MHRLAVPHTVDSFVSLFGSIHVLHAPTMESARRVCKLQNDDTSEPSLLVAKAAEGAQAGDRVPVSLCVQAAFGDAPIALTLSPYQWRDAAPPVPKITIKCGDTAAVQLELEAGTPYYVGASSLPPMAPEAPDEEEELESALPPRTVSAELGKEDTSDAEPAGMTSMVEAEPPPQPPPPPPRFFSLYATGATPVVLGNLATVLSEEMALHVYPIAGKMQPLAAGEWGALLAISVKPASMGSLSATIRLPPELPLSRCRLHAIDAASGTSTTFAGLSTGAITFKEGSAGHTIVVDAKAPPDATIQEMDWSASVIGDADAQVVAAPLSDTVVEREYEPNKRFLLFRSRLNCVGGVTCAAVHVSCSTMPEAVLTLRQLRVEAEPPAPGEDRVTSIVRSVTGVGCVTMLGLDPPADGPPTDALIECVVDERCARTTLSLPMRPTPTAEKETAVVDEEDREESEFAQHQRKPPVLVWRMRAMSAGGVTVTDDVTYVNSLAALAASWESAQAGRAGKAKAVRESYLVMLAKERAAANAAAAAECGTENNGEVGEEAGVEKPADEEHSLTGEEKIASANASGSEVPPVAAATSAENGPLVRRRLVDGVKAQLVSEHELQTSAEELKDAICKSKAELELAGSRRLALIKGAASAGVRQIEGAKAARAYAAELAASSKTKCAELIAALLPPQPEPVELDSGKGKKGKK